MKNSNFRTLRSIRSKGWLIDQESAEAYLPLVVSLLEDPLKPIGYAHNKTPELGGEAEEAFVLCVESGASTIRASKYSSFNEAPEGSIAIINISGPIMKHDAECGPLGSATINEILKAALSSPKISGAVLRVDSPGGMVDGTATFADTIKNSPKPIVAFVDDGMMASAAYWIGSAASEIIASQATDTIGSIGVYTTIADFTGYYEARGIKLKEIYSDRSKDKNKTYKDALQGDESGIKSELNFIADQFISTVKTNRAGKINLEAGNPFTGKMFQAAEAVKVGLIDSIGNFEFAVKRVSELANQETTSTSQSTQSSSNNSNSNHTSNMKTILLSVWGATLSLLNITATEGQDSIEKEISQADWEKINAGLAERETLAGRVSALEAEAAAAVTAHNEAISAANKALETMTADRDKLTAEVAKLGTQPGAMGTAAVKTKTDDIEAAADTTEEIVDMTADHNIEAMRLLGRLPKE